MLLNELTLLEMGKFVNFFVCFFFFLKGELSFQGDTLVQGGQKDGLHNGINYIEARKINFPNTTLRFYFVTRCYCDYIAGVLSQLQESPPDIIIMNSCLWDLHRYGPHGLDAFKKNLNRLLVDVGNRLGDSLFIWTATLPVNPNCIAGFLQADDLSYPVVQSKEIMAANFLAKELVREEHDKVFLNFNSYFVQQLNHRAKDGVHWNAIAHRRMTCFLLTEISSFLGLRWHGAFLGEPVLPRRHQRSSSLPELLFSYIAPPNVHRPIANASACPPRFSHPLERDFPPRLEPYEMCSRDVYPHDVYPHEINARMIRPRNGTVANNGGAFSVVARCLPFPRKRSRDEILDEREFSEQPAKRPFLFPRPHDRESCGSAEPIGNFPPRWPGQPQHRNNPAPLMQHNPVWNPRGPALGPQWIGPGVDLKAATRWNLSETLKQLWHTNISKLRRGMSVLQNSNQVRFRRPPRLRSPAILRKPTSTFPRSGAR